MTTPSCTRGHGPMEPAPPTSGLAPWMGEWWRCIHGDRSGVPCSTQLDPSPALLEQLRELSPPAQGDLLEGIAA